MKRIHWALSPTMIAVWVTIASVLCNGAWAVFNYAHDSIEKQAVQSYKISKFSPDEFSQMRTDLNQIKSDISDIKSMLKESHVVGLK